MAVVREIRNLAEHKLFEHLRKNSEDDNTERNVKCILEVREDFLFAWSSREPCILALNLTGRDGKREDCNYQILLLTDAPMFEVEALCVNLTGSQVTLRGRQGVAVVDLPRRWGKRADLEGGKEKIMCRSRNVGERFFLCNPKVEVQKVAWHPGSLTDSHLVLLTSDNCLRIYNTIEPQVAEQIISMGSGSNSTLLGTYRTTFSASLGETAIDFAFGPPIDNSHGSKTKKKHLIDEKVDEEPELPDLIWPVFILQGNGDVYSLFMGLNASHLHKMQPHGPLLMYPPADDNYGVDACSILCLQCMPPVLVIATCGGTLHHCVVLNKDDGDDTKSLSTWAHFSSSINCPNAELSLYVYESIELELSLVAGLDDDGYTCPVILHADETTPARYFCSHEAGLHTVALPLILKLQELTERPDDNSRLPSFDQECIVEHLICTRLQVSSPVSPVLGLSMSFPPPTLLCLLATYDLVCLPLVLTYQMPAQSLLSSAVIEEGHSPLRKLHKEPFEQHLQRILQRTTTQPLLKSAPGNTLTSQECMQLLSRTTQIFREEYVQKLDLAREEIEKRVHSLQGQKQQQLCDVDTLIESKEELTVNAQNIAEKYEDIKDKQEELVKRIEKVLHHIQGSQEILSYSECSFKKELLTIQNKLKHFRNSMEQIKMKDRYQKTQIAQQNVNISPSGRTKASQHSLGDKHIRPVRDILKKESADIAELVRKVNLAKQDLGM